MNLPKELAHALELEKLGEDGGLYLAATCSMLELIQLQAFALSHRDTILPTANYVIQNASVYQKSHIKAGKQVKIF